MRAKGRCSEQNEWLCGEKKHAQFGGGAQEGLLREGASQPRFSYFKKISQPTIKNVFYILT